MNFTITRKDSYTQGFHLYSKVRPAVRNRYMTLEVEGSCSKKRLTRQVSVHPRISSSLHNNQTIHTLTFTETKFDIKIKVINTTFTGLFTTSVRNIFCKTWLVTGCFYIALQISCFNKCFTSLRISFILQR